MLRAGDGSATTGLCCRRLLNASPPRHVPCLMPDAMQALESNGEEPALLPGASMKAIDTELAPAARTAMQWAGDCAQEMGG